MMPWTDLVKSMTDGVAHFATWCGTYYPTIAMLTAALCLVMGGVLLMLRKEILAYERWLHFFGLAFVVLSLQYAPAAVTRLAESWGWVSGSAMLVGAITQVLLSPLNNLFFLATARELMGKRPFPRWAIILAVATGLFGFFGRAIWSRLPDSVFSAYCLGLLAWAMYVNFRPGKRKLLAHLNLIGGTGYALVNLAFGLNPFLAAGMLWPLLRLRTGTWISMSPVSGLKVLEALDAGIFALAAPLKLGLFLGAMLLIVRCLVMLNPGDRRWGLTPVQHGRTEYLTGDGILQVLGHAVDADLVTLFYRLPGQRQSEMARWSWIKESASRKDLRDPGVEKIPEAETSIIGWVFKNGKLVTAANRNRDLFLRGRYEEKAYVSGMTALVVMPLLHHGAVVGCLNVEWRAERSFTATSVQRIRQTAEMLAPQVHSRRKLISLSRLSERLRQIELNSDHHDEATTLEELARTLQDVLSPLATGVFLNFGFRRQWVACDSSNITGRVGDPIQLGEMLGSLTQHVSGQLDPKFAKLQPQRLLVKKAPIGRLMFAIKKDCDPSGLPSLVTDYLQRRTVASLVTDAIFSFAHVELGAVLNSLQVRLNSPQVDSIVTWYGEICRAAQDAHLTWVAAKLPASPAPLCMEAYASLIDRLEARMIELPSEGEHVHALQLQDEINTPPSICLPLRISGARLWLGVSRPNFGKELSFDSPWRVFLERLAEAADSALVRIERIHLQVQASRLEIIATRHETIGMLLHELRNHAIEISALAQRIEDDLRNEGRQRDDPLFKPVIDLQKSSADFSQLATSLLRPHRADERTAILLSEALEQVKGLYRRRLATRGIELRIKGKPEIWIAVPLEVAFLTLLNLVANAGNAISSANGHGEISIEIEPVGGAALCHVIDSGPGVPSEQHERIFDMGYTSTPGHSGLGLPLVRAALQRYRGDLTLDYHWPPTRFTIRFPAPSLET